jgi:hypothetical protein
VVDPPRGIGAGSPQGSSTNASVMTSSADVLAMSPAFSSGLIQSFPAL